MQTLKTQLLDPSAAGIRTAADILRRGGLVAIPTETVYGLGADARNSTAVAAIFNAKQRPSFNPLIIHVQNVESARQFVEWPETASLLAAPFWPGPLTIVLPLRPGHGLSPLVTAGLDTVAIRVPAHPIAQELLRAFDGPVAAPSANPSGKISPTTADHVMKGLSGRIDAVLDGGACDVGLESTIVGLSGDPTLLRPGGLPVCALESALQTRLRCLSATAAPLNAPGQMLSHYAPAASVRCNAHEAREGEVLLGFGPVPCEINLSPSGDLVEAAANLFGHLHMLDKLAKPIAVSPIPNTGLGQAINDRLQRAAAPRDP